MYEIEMDEMSEAFFPCWQAAGTHLDKQVDGGIQSWLRAHPYPPVLEHLSFRLGNQLFFVRVEDVDGQVHGPGSRRALAAIARGANGRACLMPIKRRMLGGGWVPDQPGWGLIDAATGQPIDPAALVTDEKIAMTHWEVHDMAVQVVRDHLGRLGYKLMSQQGNPEVDPTIWFVGRSKGPEWVVVRSAQYPATDAERPENWDEIAEGCSRLSGTGHFASAVLASTEQVFDPAGGDGLPLWRGHPMHVKFLGLE